MIQRISILIVLVLCNTFVQAQFSELKTAVSLEFGEMEGSFTWEKQMIGKIDDVYKLHLFLVTDTKKYHGAYQLDKSKDIRFVEGGFDGDLIRLFEYDEEGKLTGTIIGDLNDYIFYGTWSDRKNTEETSFVAYSSNYELSNELNVSWVKSYEKDGHFVMLTKTNDDYSINCNFNAVHINNALNCTDEECLELNFNNLNDETEESEIMNVKILAESISINYNDSLILKLPLVNLVRLKSDNIIGEKSKSYVVSPLFQNKKLTKAWTKFVNTNLPSSSDNDSLDDFESSLDIVSDYLSTNYYSGIIRYQDNTTSDLKEVGFLLDFKKNKVLDIASFYPKGFSLNNTIEQAWSDLKTAEDYKPKLDKFNIISACKTGLLVRSKMNLIYGQSSVIIPYENLPFKMME